VDGHPTPSLLCSGLLRCAGRARIRHNQNGRYVCSAQRLEMPATNTSRAAVSKIHICIYPQRSVASEEVQAPDLLRDSRHSTYLSNYIPTYWERRRSTRPPTRRSYCWRRPDAGVLRPCNDRERTKEAVAQLPLSITSYSTA